MAYPEAHTLLTVHWLLLTTSETGQFGLRFKSPGIPTVSDLGSIAGAISTYWSASTAALPPTHALQFLRAARIGTDGKYVPGIPSVDYTYTSVVPGTGASSPVMPAQVAMVATLTTALSRGLAHQGRVYLPPIQFGLTNLNGWTLGQVNSAMNTFSACLSALQGSVLGDLSIYSRGNAANPTGARNSVTGVYADQKPDTQRRRAKGIIGAKGALQTVS